MNQVLCFFILKTHYTYKFIERFIYAYVLLYLTE